MASSSGVLRLVEAKGLVKRYPGFSLQSVNLTVDAGEIVGFVGANGAGKSTTIKALLGLIPVDGGSSSLLGVPSEKLAQPCGASVKEQVGVVFDTVSLPEHLRVADVGRMLSHAYDGWDGSLFGKYADEFGLDARKQVKDLSRGMGMKLSLACALSHRAQLLVLDEATAGLDPMAREEVLDILRGFVAEPGRGILMSSHITSDLERIADRIVCIDGGRVLFDLPKDAITDAMGVARCRKSDFERIVSSSLIPNDEFRYLMHDYGIDVLVPDRYAFSRAMPEIPCDRMTIDDYLALVLKGGVR